MLESCRDDEVPESDEVSPEMLVTIDQFVAALTQQFQTLVSAYLAAPHESSFIVFVQALTDLLGENETLWSNDPNGVLNGFGPRVGDPTTTGQHWVKCVTAAEREVNGDCEALPNKFGEIFSAILKRYFTQRAASLVDRDESRKSEEMIQRLTAGLGGIAGAIFNGQASSLLCPAALWPKL